MFNNFSGITSNADLWLPEIINTKPPGVYKVVKEKGDWNLVLDSEKFIIDSKIYGKVNFYRDHIWSSFNRRNKTMSCLFSGLSGSGKTLLGMLLCNKGLEHGYFVVNITEVQPDAKLLRLLSSLDNCIVLLDEFGKTFNYSLQQQALTMLTIQDGKKKMFILTENSVGAINTFMINRPGRIRYHVKFDRLEKEVVIGYCKDKHVDRKFVKELLTRYVKASNFTYDHLEALIEEHLNYREMSMDDILEILNIDIISKVKAYKVIRGVDSEGNVYVVNPMYIKEDSLKSRFGIPFPAFTAVTCTNSKGEQVDAYNILKHEVIQRMNKKTPVVYDTPVVIKLSAMDVELMPVEVDDEEFNRKHPTPINARVVKPNPEPTRDSVFGYLKNKQN